MNTTAKPPKRPRRRPAVVIPFHKGAPPWTPPPWTPGTPVPRIPVVSTPRELCTVPGFLAAVRHAREKRPDLEPAEILAAAHVRGVFNYVVGETVWLLVDQRRAALRAARSGL